MTFENYLQEKHFEENQQLLDDDLPDAFEEWASNLDVQEVIDYAEKWGKLTNLNKEVEEIPQFKGTKEKLNNLLNIKL